MSRFAKNLNMLNCESLTRNCVHYMHEMFGLVEKLNTENFIYSTENCVHYICTECLELQRN